MTQTLNGEIIRGCQAVGATATTYNGALSQWASLQSGTGTTLNGLVISALQAAGGTETTLSGLWTQVLTAAGYSGTTINALQYEFFAAGGDLSNFYNNSVKNYEDDGHEVVGTSFSTTTNLLQVAEVGTGEFGAGSAVGAFCISDVPGAQGHVTTSADLFIDVIVNGATNCTVRLQDPSESSEPFSATNLPSDATFVTGSATFSAATTGVKTVDVTTLVNNCYGDAAWEYGKCMNFAVTGVSLFIVIQLGAKGETSDTPDIVRLEILD